MANYLMGRHGVGNRKACRCVRLHRSMYYYRSRMNPLTALRERMRELAHHKAGYIAATASTTKTERDHACNRGESIYPSTESSGKSV